jgi:hypothetical protein
MSGLLIYVTSKVLHASGMFNLFRISPILSALVSSGPVQAARGKEPPVARQLLSCEVFNHVPGDRGNVI